MTDRYFLTWNTCSFILTNTNLGQLTSRFHNYHLWHFTEFTRPFVVNVAHRDPSPSSGNLSKAWEFPFIFFGVGLPITETYFVKQLILKWIDEDDNNWCAKWFLGQWSNCARHHKFNFSYRMCETPLDGKESNPACNDKCEKWNGKRRQSPQFFKRFPFHL